MAPLVWPTRRTSRGRWFNGLQYKVNANRLSIRIRKVEDQINPVIVEHYRESLESRLEGYEVLLSKQKYMAGDVGLTLSMTQKLFG